MTQLFSAVHMLGSSDAWLGDGGFGRRILEHGQLTFLTVLFACAMGLPLGVWLGARSHTGSGRGSDGIVAALGALRALPTLGLVTWLTLILPFGIAFPRIPAIIVLVILAVPPVVAAGYAGISSLDHAVVDAARAMGHSGWQSLTRVQIPLALPTIIGGIRSATVQVLATATVAAYIGAGGLGRPLIDGLALRDYPLMLAGAVLVIILAWFVDLVFALLQRCVRPHR